MTQETIIVYGADWCGDCRRTRRFLNQLDISYRWIDIERDKQGEQYVKSVNRGMRSIPTILFPDGSLLVEPSNEDLAVKLSLAEFA